MGNFVVPGINHNSKIYRMARKRNYKVLVSSLVVFLFGGFSLYDGIVRPGVQTPVSLLISCVIIGVSFYGFYLFLARTRDVFRHPDAKKFLSFDDPRRYLDLFEQEYEGGSLKQFRGGFVTRSFVVAETFYRFRWAHYREVKMAYVEPARILFHRIPFPFFGISAVMVHLRDGSAIQINCDSKEDAETLLMLLARMAPSAHYGSAIEDEDPSADLEAIAREVAAMIRQKPDLTRTDSHESHMKRTYNGFPPDFKTSPLAAWIKGNAPVDRKAKGSPAGAPGAAVKPEPGRVRPLRTEEIFRIQTKTLYNSLEKGDIATSVALIDSMGDARNVEATDILAILLECPDEPIRVHAASALGNLGQGSAVEPLIRALDDPAVEVREKAAAALGEIGDQRAVAPLQQVPPRDVRTKKAAVGALARIDQKLHIFNQPGPGFFNTLK